MHIAIPKEIRAGERRVAATPDSVADLIAAGFVVSVEAGAGAASTYDDDAYAAAGAKVVAHTRALWASAEIVLKVQPPSPYPALDVHEADLLAEGATLVSFIQPEINPDVLGRLERRGATVIAMEKVPRITRAQKMDALSSMANLAGYRAVIEAANHFGSFFCAQFTAAGKVPPARVLVIGAGVAGLAAIGAARGLGAEVRAFDTRLAVKDQVGSLGATFLEVDIEEDGDGGGGYGKVMSQAFIDAEMALFRAQAKEVDIVITTALIPGRKAPTLWTRDMVEAMKPGSVVVDLAASHGGNCEVTVNGEAIVHHGVHILGYTDLACRMAPVASSLYARNLVHLLSDISADGALNLDPDDDVVRGAVIRLAGSEPSWPEKSEQPAAPAASAQVAASAPAASAPAASAQAPAAPRPAASKRSGHGHGNGGHGGHGGHGADAEASSKLGVWIATAAVAGLFVVWMALTGQGDAASIGAGRDFLQHLTVFVLSCVVGWHVVWNVAPALHTPLMSVTNAISGIIVLGGLLHLDGAGGGLVRGLAIAAVALATINVAGGFLVTRRMLTMFRK